MTITVILIIASILLGMAISIKAFGTGGKKADVFKDIYFSSEDVDGIGIIYTKSGDYSAVLEIDNTVQMYSADIDSYYEYSSLLTGLCQSLGEGYILHKQDIFVRRRFDGDACRREDMHSYLYDSYFDFFKGREYTDVKTYLIITQENRKSRLFSYDIKKWKDFLLKLRKVESRLKDSNMRCQFLSAKEAREYIDRYFAMNFRDENFSMSNFKVSSESICTGDRETKVYSLVDVDNISLPGLLRPYTDITVNNSVIPVDIMSGLERIPDMECAVYNQVIFMPNQKRELSVLDKKKNRHSSLPSPSNQMAVEDIKSVQNIIAREGKQLVYAHFSLAVTVGKGGDISKAGNYLENMFSKIGIQISKRAYNQLELFVAGFPGNASRLNAEYDRFLTLSDAAMCLMYKERPCRSEKTPVEFWYTDRQGVPVAMDMTGKEGQIKYTDNSNYFCLGPSGSGKSYFMNSVMRQFYMQNTDVVIVDTGNSYESLCNINHGTYITYSKEHPISMNPFKVTEEEYKYNFDEKKSFIQNLIVLIYLGDKEPTKIQDTLLKMLINEYYEEYFTPFTGFSEEERNKLRRMLSLTSSEMQETTVFDSETLNDFIINHQQADSTDNEVDDKTLSTIDKLRNLVNDPASSEGERIAATHQIQRLMPEAMRDRNLILLNKKIDRMEEERRKIHVKQLSFNTFYEFSLQRVPQLLEMLNLKPDVFDTSEYATVLSPFYRGGEYETVLNSDMEGSLFDERFIVFELDQISKNKLLTAIILLIIMDVFTQKMRLKKCRKTLVIEEAWKAIATPTMAEYIKYLYKTARKHWASVGMVTQELQDITGNAIVKDAIINNSGVFMLLDQSKFKDKFQDIKETLALTDIDCKKIFTINRLDNKEGRNQFNEVYIKRGNFGEVYGVEEPHECYMSSTTEKIEKEALKLYMRELGVDYEDAIKAYCRDWERSGISKPIAFAQKVQEAGHVLNLR